MSAAAAEADIVLRLKQAGLYHRLEWEYVPTGLLISSLEFTAAHDVHLTGHVWQNYPEMPAAGEPVPQIEFPEAVGSQGSGALQDGVCTERADRTASCHWSFEITLRQDFKYGRYPLDHKIVWVRMIPAGSARNVMLIPALDDYASTRSTDTFGVAKGLVLGGWEHVETFFDYKMVDHDTNLGLTDDSTHQLRPELRFNIVIVRRFLNAFIVHVVPIFTVTLLLYAILLTITLDRERAAIRGFNITGTIGIISALFFVVMVSHVHVREQFASERIVYIEGFFLTAYLIMIGVCMNAYACTVGRTNPWFRVLRSEGNLVARMAYWPLTLGFMLAVTFWSLHEN